MTAQHDSRAPGGEAGSADTELLRLEAELLRLIEEINAGKHPVVDGDTGDEAMERVAEMELAIAERPAHTPAGVAVKVRRLRASYEGGKTDWDRPLFNTALDALARLSTEPEPTDAEIVRMWHEHCVLIAKCNAAHEALKAEEGNALFAQADKLSERILVTQARTPAGIAVKLKIAAEVEGLEKEAKEYPKLVEPRAVLSALDDLERLAGGYDHDQG
ncbi:MAG: hypothetical protein ACE5MH_10600 [Terriglobia bacterium]